MAKSRDSYNKKEKEKKRLKKKKDKEERRERRKLEGNKTEEFMYQDADGNLTATPPDPAQKIKYKLEDIEISVPKQDKSDVPNFLKTGTVKFFNTEKGYGFIVEDSSRTSYFVHADSLIDQIRDNDKVSFEVGKGPKGPVANDVRLVK